MAKEKKQRAEKYETKLSAKGNLDSLIKIGVAPRKKDANKKIKE